MADSDAPRVDRSRMSSYYFTSLGNVCGRNFDIIFGTQQYRVVFIVTYDPTNPNTYAQLATLRRPSGAVATSGNFYGWATWEDFWQVANAYNPVAPWSGDRVGDWINMPVATGAWSIACRQRRPDGSFTDSSSCTIYTNGNGDSIDEGSPILGDPNVSLDKIFFRAHQDPELVT